LNARGVRDQGGHGEAVFSSRSQYCDAMLRCRFFFPRCEQISF
jgi:hypothetical protein